jgi:hypothetical protein
LLLLQTKHPRRWGYGPFLKQRWLSNTVGLPTVVPISNWLNATPLIVDEMHAQRPVPDSDGITATDNRVRHKPSLGEQGVDGRTNPEALGSKLHPFQFSLGDVN